MTIKQLSAVFFLSLFSAGYLQAADGAVGGGGHIAGAGPEEYPEDAWEHPRWRVTKNASGPCCVNRNDHENISKYYRELTKRTTAPVGSFSCATDDDPGCSRVTRCVARIADDERSIVLSRDETENAKIPVESKHPCFRATFYRVAWAPTRNALAVVKQEVTDDEPQWVHLSLDVYDSSGKKISASRTGYFLEFGDVHQNALQWSPDSRRIAVGNTARNTKKWSSPSMVTVIDPDQLVPLYRFGFGATYNQRPVKALGWSADGKKMQVLYGPESGGEPDEVCREYDAQVLDTLGTLDEEGIVFWDTIERQLRREGFGFVGDFAVLDQDGMRSLATYPVLKQAFAEFLVAPRETELSMQPAERAVLAQALEVVRARRAGPVPVGFVAGALNWLRSWRPGYGAEQAGRRALQVELLQRAIEIQDAAPENDGLRGPHTPPLTRTMKELQRELQQMLPPTRGVE